MKKNERLIRHINDINKLYNISAIECEEKFDREEFLEMLPKTLPEDFVDFFLI